MESTPTTRRSIDERKRKARRERWAKDRVKRQAESALRREEVLGPVSAKLLAEIRGERPTAAVPMAPGVATSPLYPAPGVDEPMGVVLGPGSDFTRSLAYRDWVREWRGQRDAEVCALQPVWFVRLWQWARARWNGAGA